MVFGHMLLLRTVTHACICIMFYIYCTYIVHILYTDQCPPGFFFWSKFMDTIFSCEMEGCELERASEHCSRCKCCKKWCAQKHAKWKEKCTWPGNCDFCPECSSGECYQCCPGWPTFLTTIARFAFPILCPCTDLTTMSKTGTNKAGQCQLMCVCVCVCVFVCVCVCGVCVCARARFECVQQTRVSFYFHFIMSFG